jgi:hypothetical protein
MLARLMTCQIISHEWNTDKMELIKAPSTQIMKNLQVSTDLKTQVLMNEQVQNGLSEIEFRVAKSSLLVSYNGGLVAASKSIKTLSTAELIEEVKKTLKFIIRDIGIKNWSNEDAMYDSTRFVNLLKSYYSDLTYSEIELAFELLSAHALDDYLPKSAGQPDRSHYQSFSSEYIGKVLNAFRGYKNSIWVKANRLKPNEERVVTEEEKEYWAKTFVDGICNKFEEYEKDGEFPTFPIAFKVVEVLQAAGFVEEVEITQRDRQAAVVALTNNSTKSSYDKAKYKAAFREKQPSKELDAYAEIRAMERAIKKAFDEMIKKKINPRSILK